MEESRMTSSKGRTSSPVRKGMFKWQWIKFEGLEDECSEMIIGQLSVSLKFK